MIQLDALKKRPERHTDRQTDRNWHVGPVLTSLALDKNKDHLKKVNFEKDGVHIGGMPKTLDMF